MWVRTQLKIEWLDLLAGAWNCFKSNDRESLRRSVENFFSDSGNTIAAYSVRSGFDFLIQALDLKPGDEIREA
jgi:perosamine synthetase